MPPWSWIACWPMKRPERPICTLAAAIALRRSAAFVLLRHHGREHRHAARLLERDQHVDGAVLQHLERADRHAELLAGLEVLDGELVHLAHGADRLGAERRDRLVDHALDQRQRVVRGRRAPPRRRRARWRARPRRRAARPASDSRGATRRRRSRRPGTAPMPLRSRRPPAMRAVTTSLSALSPCSDDALGAVEHIARAVALRRRRDVGEVVARLALGVREGKQSARRRRSAGSARRAAPSLAPWRRKPPPRIDGREIGLERERAAERLHDDHRLDRRRRRSRHAPRRRAGRAGRARHIAPTASRLQPSGSCT